MPWTIRRIVNGVSRRLRRPPAVAPPSDLEHRTARLRAILAERLPDPPEVVVVRDPTLFCAYDAVIEREPGLLRFVLPTHNPWVGQGFLDFRGSCYAFWLLSTPKSARRMTVTLADGNEATLARFAPSSNISEIVAIPDPYFFETRGFADIRHIAATENVAWGDRSAELTWRGSTTGLGLFQPLLAIERPAMVAPRLRACAMLVGVPGTDVKFASSVRPELHEGGLERFGFMGANIEQKSWIGRKYALDIDGHANTWSNLIVRLLLGCCVLKVASEANYRQWYYDRLKPWEHYVPVKADCSDLVEKFDWVRAHDAEARAIASNGQAFAASMSFETVRAEAAELIAANWDR